MGTLYVTIGAGEQHHDFSSTITFYKKEYGLTTLSNFFWGKKQMGFKAPADEDAKATETTFTPTFFLIQKLSFLVFFWRTARQFFKCT